MRGREGKIGVRMAHIELQLQLQLQLLLQLEAVRVTVCLSHDRWLTQREEQGGRESS